MTATEQHAPRTVVSKNFFIGGTVTFTLGPWGSLLGRIPDKNDRYAFTRGSRGEVMIFFKKQTRLEASGGKKGVRPCTGFSYFERFHWPILNFWTLKTVEHDGNGTACTTDCSVQKFT
jgi:hypothetical protein